MTPAEQQVSWRIVLLCMRALSRSFHWATNYTAPRAQLALADLAPAGYFSSSQHPQVTCIAYYLASPRLLA